MLLNGPIVGTPLRVRHARVCGEKGRSRQESSHRQAQPLSEWRVIRAESPNQG